jgi:predicted nucleic acid binding AN1-type Zn finger protein
MNHDLHSDFSKEEKFRQILSEPKMKNNSNIISQIESTQTLSKINLQNMSSENITGTYICSGQCSMDSCQKKVVYQMIGKCKYCQLSFCQNHRLPENHCCLQLDDCREIKYQQNKNMVKNSVIRPSKLKWEI